MNRTILVLIFVLFNCLQVETAEPIRSFMLQDSGVTGRVILHYKGFIIGSGNSDIVQRDIETGQIVRTLRGHNGQVFWFSILGDHLYSVGSDERIVVWDLEKGQIIRRIVLQQCKSSLGFIVTDNHIFASCDTRIVKQYNRETGGLIRNYGIGDRFNWNSSPAANGNNLFLLTSNFRIAQHNLNNGFLVQYFEGHTQFLCCLDFDEDGYMYSCGDDSNVFKWDVQIATQLMNFNGFSGRATAIKVANNAVYISNVNTELYKWNTTTGGLVFALKGLPDPLTSLDVTEDLIISGSVPGVVAIFNPAGELVKVFTHREKRIRPIAVTDQFLLGGVEDGSIPVFDTSISEMVTVLAGVYSPINDLFVYKNGTYSYLFAVTARSKIFQWELEEFTITKNITYKDVLYTITADENFFWVGDSTGSITKWSVQTDSIVHEWIGHEFIVMKLIRYQDFLFSASQDGFAKQWAASDSSIVTTLNPNEPLYALALSIDMVFFSSSTSLFGCIIGNTVPELAILIKSPSYSLATFQEQFVISGQGDGGIVMYKVDTGQEVFTFRGHTGIVFGLQVSGNILYSGSFDGTMKKFAIENARLMYSFEDKTLSVDSGGAIRGKVYALLRDGSINSFLVQNSSFDGTLRIAERARAMLVANEGIYVGDAAGSVRLFDHDLKLPSNLTTDEDRSAVSTLFVFGDKMFVGKESGGIRIYDLLNVSAIVKFFDEPSRVNSIAANADFVFTCSDSSFSKWDLATGKKTKTYIGHKESVTSLVISEQFIFSGSLDKTIKQWDVFTDQLLNEFLRTPAINGHLGPVFSICVVGRLLFSASGDTTARMWDIRTRRVLEVYIGHTRSIFWVAHDNGTLFTGGDDQITFAWNAGISPLDDKIISKSPTLSARRSSIIVPRFRRLESDQQQFSDFAVPLIAGLAAFLLIVGAASYLIMLRAHSSKNTLKPIDISKDQYSTQTTTGTASTMMGTFVTKTTGIAKPAYLETDTREFRILKQIAQGGGGIVYVGEFLTESKISRFAKTIIVKKVGESYEGLTKRLRDNFDQEISLMEFFRNEKHIAKLYGYCHVPCCIIMKYYPKKSLDAFIEANKYPLWLGLSFAMDISKGLKTMHTKSVAHNDLKPQNVLLDTESNGRLFCVLTDFGISHILEENVIAAKAFSVVNLRGISAKYASPEAYERFRKATVASGDILKAGDIYCFAGILYDLLMRKSPWDRSLALAFKSGK